MLTLHSPAFHQDSEIPSRYTRDGENKSPPLRWNGVPGETREFALLCLDPDAATPEPFIHWVIYNIPGAANGLKEGIEPHESISPPVRADQGRNSWNHVGYGGPMPPEGDGPHRYVFRLYALDTELGLAPGATEEELIEAMQGHVIETAELVGTYERTPAKARHKKSA